MRWVVFSLAWALVACARDAPAPVAAESPAAGSAATEAPGAERARTPGTAVADGAVDAATPPDGGAGGASLAAQLEAMNLRPVAAASGNESGLSTLVVEFLKAVNSRDRARARALCTPACWAGECRSFAEQAGTKFEARASTMVERGDRAVVSVDVVCPGKGLCDRVSLLVVRTAGGLRVADITESEKKAREFLDGGR